MKKIAVVGHRRLLYPEKVRGSIASSFDYFKEQYTDLQAISAIAAGADTIFAEEALKEAIPLRLIIPFELDEYKKDFNAEDLIQFKEIIKKNPYEILQKLSSNTPDERNEAYLAVGKKLVDECDILVAVWDRNSAKGKGGTGDIVAYAESQGKEIHIIKGVREDNLATDKVHREFTKLDNDAIKYKKRRFERAWRFGLVLGVFAVIFFAYGLNFHPEHCTKFLIACLEISSLAVSAFLLLRLVKNYKDKFLENRRNAEYLRSVIWFKEARIPLPLFTKTDFKVADEVLAIEKNIAKEITAVENFANAKRMAWCLAHEQIDYHHNIRVKPFHKNIENMELLFSIIKTVFFVAVLLKFLIEALEFFKPQCLHCIEDLLPYLNTLIITLPPAYAALEGYKYFNEWKRNIEISKNKMLELKECKNRIFDCKDENKLIDEAKNLRHILENENSDWAKRIEEGEIGVQI